MDPVTIGLIVQVALKYGPPAAIAISELFQNKDVTHDDIVRVFGGLKKYEDYGIPDKVPTVSVASNPAS